jgi:hypothetical protein
MKDLKKARPKRNTSVHQMPDDVVGTQVWAWEDIELYFLARHTPYSPSKDIVGYRPISFFCNCEKFEFGEAFCEKVTQLVIGVDFNQFNLMGTYVFSEPMIFYCVVF